MAKRKNTRMFSRDERQQARGEQLRRAGTVTQEQLDHAAIAQLFDRPPTSSLGLAEGWLGLWRDEGEGLTELEAAAMSALAREYERLTGVALTPERAEEEIDADFEKRDALFEGHRLSRAEGGAPAPV